MTTSEIQTENLETQQTDCCIVGGGPAGAILALLLARQGISVTLLEKHKDFAREFRGDTIHPITMEVLDQIGLAEPLLQKRHSKLSQLQVRTPKEVMTLADLSQLKTKFPYITVMPQEQFLEFITEQAQQYSGFQLLLGANVQELIQEQGVVGVRYRGQGGQHEIRARLTVAADGRASRLRELAGLVPHESSSPMDVLWFRLPKFPEDGANAELRIGGGRMLVLIDRFDHWQLGLVIPKGGYQQLRQAGLDHFRQEVAHLAPEFSKRLNHLQNWTEMAFLAVAASYLPRWYLPGLLFVGDAAHVMTPVAGVGINVAIQDAIVAANVLIPALKKRQVEQKHLAAIQNRRLPGVRIMQTFQSLIQRQVISPALDSQTHFKLPILLKLPLVRQLPARLIAFGAFPARLIKPPAE